MSNSDLHKYFPYIEPIEILDLCRYTGLDLKQPALLFILSLIMVPLWYRNLYPPDISVRAVMLRSTIKGTWIYLNRNTENKRLISPAFVMLPFCALNGSKSRSCMLNAVENRAYTGWSKSLCAPDDYSTIIRCTETFWSSCIMVQIGVIDTINELIKLSLHSLEYIHNTCTKIFSHMFRHSMCAILRARLTGWHPWSA